MKCQGLLIALLFLMVAFGVPLVWHAPAELGRAQAAIEKTKRGAEGKMPLPAGALARLGNSRFDEFNQSGLSVRFLPDGRTVATVGWHGKVEFWEVMTGKAIRTLEGHVCMMTISPDGKKLASKRPKDNSIHLFNLETGKPIGQVETIEWLTAACFSPDSRFLALGGGSPNQKPDDPPLKIWDAATCKPVKQLPISVSLNRLAFSHDGKMLATSKYIRQLTPCVQIWELATAKQILAIHHHDSNLEHSGSSLSFSPDDTLLITVGPYLFAWNSHTGKLVWENRTVSGSGIAFSPNGRMLALGGGKRMVRFFETTTGRIRAQIDQGASFGPVAFSPCGLMLGSVEHDFTTLIWDVTGQIQATKNPPPPIGIHDLDSCWADLGGEDAAKAWQAICALSCRPDQAVPFLKKRLPAKPKLDPKLEARLRTDLEKGIFLTREHAYKELKAIGPPAVPFLRELQASLESTDAKQRIGQLLGEPGKKGILTEEARCCAAIETLEYIGTALAKELLEAQAQGEPTSRITQDARAALSRLSKLAASKT